MPITDTQAMIAGMTPELRSGVFVFLTVNDAALFAELAPKALGIFHETKGSSLILPLRVAQEAGLAEAHPMRQITLNVFSALDGIGLTAAVAGRLAEQGIPCNVVAATQHDHVFVPQDKAKAALKALLALQADAVAGG